MNWIWFGIRVLGLTSYLLLTLSVLGGILRGVPKKKFFLLQFHQQIGQIALPPPEKGDGRAKDKDNVKGPMYVRVIMRRRLQLDLTQEALRTFSW